MFWTTKKEVKNKEAYIIKRCEQLVVEYMCLLNNGADTEDTTLYSQASIQDFRNYLEQRKLNKLGYDQEM